MALRRKFKGKYYDFDAQYHNEVRAQWRADRLRKQGHKARVIKAGLLTWEVWVR